MFLLAADDPLALADTIMKLVTAGGFGGLVWYLVIRHIPSIEQRHRDERAAFMQYIDKRDKKLEQIANEFSTRIDDITEHHNETIIDIRVHLGEIHTRLENLQENNGRVSNHIEDIKDELRRRGSS